MNEILEMTALKDHMRGSAIPLRSSSLKMLDFWRGVACFAVILFHWTIQWGCGHHGLGEIHPLHIVLKQGYLGTDFFVISGYCIAAAVINASERGKGAWSFLNRALLENHFPYWISLAVIEGMKSSRR